jgi:serine/threonine protein kinase
MGSHAQRKLFNPGDAVGVYTIVRLLGQGGYGDTYSVTRPETDVPLAMKVVSDHDSLATEMVIMPRVQKSPLFPRVVEFGRGDSYSFMVTELLGPSLSNTRRHLPGGRYSLSTVLRLSFFMLECIREFHKHGFVHRDLKPGNFLLKLGPTNPLALIDFGLARVFIDEATGQPFPESAQTAFHGTVTYASVNAQLFHDQSPRDDLVSWLYSLVELAEGYLPWSADSDPTVIQNRKVAISDRTLMRSLPREF